MAHWLEPVFVPYSICLVSPGNLGTKGGLKINLHGQVLGVCGDVIEGLYVSETNTAALVAA